MSELILSSKLQSLFKIYKIGFCLFNTLDVHMITKYISKVRKTILAEN